MKNLTTALAISRVSEIPPTYKKTLVDRFGSIEELWLAIEKGQATHDEELKVFQWIKQKVDFKRAEAQVLKIQKMKNIWALEYRSPNYPKYLSEISDPPLVLFGVGEMPKEEETFLSVVGPRKASSYGLRIAKLLCNDLATEGLTLVSGLARGIDSVAHGEALRAKKPTIAVLGCGVDLVYPPEHALLKSHIEKGGAVVSEFWLCEGAEAWHFPLRNRIITGLSKALLVIEAGEKSGARISAKHALDQSREVYAVPGPIDSPLSMYTNQLISEGAKLVASSQEILEDYFPQKKFDSGVKNKVPHAELSKEATRLLSGLEVDSPVGVDDLMNKSEMSIGVVLQSLLELELKGIVAKQKDARYVRVAR